MSKNCIEMLKENLKLASVEMETDGDTASKMFYILLDILKKFDLLEMFKEMKDEGEMFAAICFLQDYTHNLESNFNEGTKGFPEKDGLDIYHNILKDIGKFIRCFVISDEKKEIAEIIKRLYVNYALLLSTTEEAIEQQPDQEFICI